MDRRIWIQNLDRNRLNVDKSKESKEILLSILIPSLFNRQEVFNELIDKLEKQIKENKLDKQIEIITHIDNKNVRLIRKRNNMLLSSKGKFVALLDDDDTVSDDYIKEIVNKIKEKPESDVITFKQHCNCDGWEFGIISDINFKLHVKHVGDSNYIRYPWIWCVWRRENVVDISFEDSNNKINYGEDKEWLLQVMKSNKIKIETKIDKVLHYYRFDRNKTETQK